MEQAEKSAVAEALNRLWTQFLPQTEERVVTLEAAATALGAGTLTEGQREAASAAAHKLAGVLGTFGLAEGTSLAREAEIALSGKAKMEQAAAARLMEIGARLRAIVAGRQS